MRVLVTGGGGFIGGHLVDGFRAKGARVSVIDNLSTGSTQHLPDDVELHEVDIRDRDAVFRAFEAAPPEVVLHHAAQADVRRSMDDPIYDASVNLLGSINLLDAAKRFGTTRFVFASTGGAVYGEPTTIPVPETHEAMPLSCYGASKRAVEVYLPVYAAGWGLPVTVLRYANVYGPRQNPKGEAGVVAIFSLQMLEGKTPIIFGDGSKTRDYVFVGDVVRANLLAVEKQQDGVFNIGTGRRTSDRQVFDAVRAAVGARVEPQMGMIRKGEIEHIALDASRAKAILGWEPSVDFEAGVAQAVAWYRQHFAPSKT